MNKAIAIFDVVKLSLSKFENYEAFFENYIKKEKEESHHSGILSEDNIDGDLKSLSKKGYFTIEAVGNTRHFTLHFKNSMNHKLLELSKMFFEKLTKALTITFKILNDNT